LKNVLLVNSGLGIILVDGIIPWIRHTCVLQLSSKRRGVASSIDGSCLESPGLTSGLRKNRH